MSIIIIALIKLIIGLYLKINSRELHGAGRTFLTLLYTTEMARSLFLTEESKSVKEFTLKLLKCAPMSLNCPIRA
jgi:hypothetical protein